MDDEQSGSTDTFSDDGIGIPEYVNYVNLLYHLPVLPSTVFTIGMDSLIISTILNTRSFHNILIVNLMVADIVIIVVYTLQNVGRRVL